MQLSNPLETVMRPATANVLLAVHRGGQRLTGRRVAGIVGSSPSRTLEHLRSLTAAGLIQAERTQVATFYSINERHLLWPALQCVIEARTEFHRRLVEVAERLPDGTAVALYGSVAAYRSAAESDVDLLVVYPDETRADLRDEHSARLAEQVTAWTGNRAEIFDLTRSQLADLVVARDPMVSSWQRDLEVVSGDLAAVLQPAA